MKEKIEQLLLKTQKPSRYIGGEHGSIIKDKSKVDVRFAFCFPDVYDVGMSHLGMKILYGLKNSVPNYWCESVSLCPKKDFEKLMREKTISLSMHSKALTRLLNLILSDLLSSMSFLIQMSLQCLIWQESP